MAMKVGLSHNIKTFESNILHWIFSPVIENGILWIRRNSELRDLFKQNVKLAMLKIIKKEFDNVPVTSPPRGKLWIKWIDNMD